MDEGVAQVFTKLDTNRKIIGTVGALQFDVIQYRLEHEYGAKCTYEPLAMHKACWVDTEDKAAMAELKSRRKKNMAMDKDGKLVYLAESAWTLKMAEENHPEVSFFTSSEF